MPCQSTRQQEQSSRPYFNQKTSLDATEKSKSHSLQSKHEEPALVKPPGIGAAYRASLTSSADMPAEASASAHSHPSGLMAGKSHLTTSKPMTIQSASAPSPSRGTNKRTTLLGQLPGYPSSEEDDTGQGSSTPRKSNKQKVCTVAEVTRELL